jgi:hypothetical protein
MLWGGLYARGSANGNHGVHKARPTLIHTRAKARGYGWKAWRANALV